MECRLDVGAKGVENQNSGVLFLYDNIQVTFPSKGFSFPSVKKKKKKEKEKRKKTTVPTE